MTRGRALIPDRSQFGREAPVGASAVAAPGWVVAGRGCRVAAIDGGRVKAVAGSKAWVWDGGSAVASAGSEVHVGRYGLVDAEPGARVYADGGTLIPPEAWPVIYSRGSTVRASAAHVYADEASNVSMVERGTLTTVGFATVDIVDGREVHWVRANQFPTRTPRGIDAPVRFRSALSGEPDPDQTAEDWLEPILGALRDTGIRVDADWSLGVDGPIRAFYGGVHAESLDARIALPGSISIMTRSNGRIANISSIYGPMIVARKRFTGGVGGKLRGG